MESKIEMLTREAALITAIAVSGMYHAIKPQRRYKILRYTTANYRETGQAFCGILAPGESISNFRQRWINSQMKFR